MVSGWGQNMFGAQGAYQQILKKVDVPIVAPATCQSQLQTARLGVNFVLDTTSFVCAGGEANKDSCTVSVFLYLIVNCIRGYNFQFTERTNRIKLSLKFRVI